jgi:TonB family protein
MGYKALLFCPDEKTARVVTQVLSDLEFTVERCNEAFAAVKSLTSQHFDAVVVDCEQEQNATLIFKSARNSASNKTSLAVAMVEGQSGVAKAFRIGANLVLTKPINVEQSKGTLRVARGLLRKAGTTEGAVAPSSTLKPIAHAKAAGAGFATPPAPGMPYQKPALANVPAPPPASSVPAISASLLEVEQEPALSPEPTEVALFESIPDPSAALQAQVAGSGLSSDNPKQYPWQPVSKPAEPAPGSTDLRNKPAASNKLPTIAGNAPAGRGAASAPAPARERPQFGSGVVDPAATVTADSIEEAVDLLAGKKFPGVTSELDSHLFSSVAGDSEGQVSNAGTKKALLMVAAVVVVMAAGYLGWTKVNPATKKTMMGFFAGNSGAPVQKQSPITSPAATQIATPSLIGPPAAAQPVTSTQQIGISDATTSRPPYGAGGGTSTKPSQAAGSGAEPKHSAGPNFTASDVSATVDSKETTSSRTPDVIVVQGGKAPSSVKPTQEAEVEPPPSPNALGVAPAGDSALSRIVTTAPAAANQPILKAVRVSQGLSQGLLVHRVQPAYPAVAIQSHREGAVQLQANISEEGNVTAVKVLSGDRVLARAAVEAVKQWKYKPYLLDGQPIAIETQITLNFKP